MKASSLAASGGKPVAWRFDDVVVSAAAFRVTVDGLPRPLEPKSFRLLQFLIENRQRAVSKEEIFQAVWAGTFVTDNALTRAIVQIRKAIGDDPRQPRYLETVPTVGYRFAAPVEEVFAQEEESPAESPAPVARAPGQRLRAFVGGAIALIVVGGLAAWMMRPAAVSIHQNTSFKPVQFSSSPGLDVGASFSPDGSLVAYASDKSGSFEIYVKSFDPTGRELQITDDGNENLYPAFSPDGGWIAFTSTRRRGIFRVPAIGGAAQRLTDFGVQPVWSPDGRMLVFRSSAPTSLSTTDYYWPADSNLWMVQAGGGTPVQITGRDGQPLGGQSFPSFSRDGTEIRFLNHFKNEASIWTYRIADGSLHKRFFSTTFFYSNPTFARDDTRMWFVNWQLNGDMGIWQLPLDPVAFAPAGKAESVYPSQYAVPLDLRLSADGARLAFTAAFSQSAIMAQSIAHRASASVSLTHDTSFRYTVPRSAPDGSRLIYTSIPRSGFARQWIVNADGTAPAALQASGGADAFYGGLSADNRQAFFTEFRGNTPQLIAVNLVDGASKRLADLPDGAEQIACSRDCASALFHRVVDDRRQVYRLDTHAAASHVVVSRKDDVDFARFSRDDKWISVELTHRPFGGNDIAVLPAEGGPLDVVLKSDQPSFAAGWLPDGDRILFAGFRDAAWNIFTVSRTTHKVEQLTSYTSMRTYVRYPDWLVGERIVYEFNESKGNVFVATVAH